MKARPILMLLSACAVVVFSQSFSLAGKSDKKLDVYWVDVEGGAATLIVTPSGESILIDTGNPGRRDPNRIFDVAARIAGLRKIDHLIVTHYHGDHFGGAAALSSILPIGILHDNGTFPEGKERPNEEYLNFKCDQRSVIEPGQQIELHQSENDAAAKVSLKCLAARQKFPAEESGTKNEALCAEFAPKDRDGSDNANSIVVLLSLGDFQLFDAGDLTWNIEHQLVCPNNRVGIVDVYQVTHHGLESSNNPVLVKSLQPTVAVMNNGTTKGCDPEVFATLKGIASIEAIYQLHKNLRPDGSVNNTSDEYIANHDEKCEGAYVHLAVEPDGKSYTISIPARNHSRTYQTK